MSLKVVRENCLLFIPFVVVVVVVVVLFGYDDNLID
jgi:hypothetical protein